MKASLTKLAFASLLSIATVTPSFAAIEIDEKDFGPSYGKMVADTVVGKPLGALAVVGGTAAWIVSAPFAMLGGNLDQSADKLVREPAQALHRCLGCTPAEDQYYKSRNLPKNQVRVVVDRPSEILINTDQNVVVKTVQ